MENKVYAQIYSINRHNPDGALKAIKTLADIGYDGIELLRCNTEGLTIPEFLKYLEDLNVKMISTYGQPYQMDNDADLEMMQALGIRYFAFAVNDKLRTTDELLELCDDLNKKGEKAHKYGLQMIFHNHSLEFRTVQGLDDGTLIHEYILQNTDPKLVGAQLDVGWAVRGGCDVVEYVKKHAGRFPIIHAKDCNKIAENDYEKEHFPPHIMEMPGATNVKGVRIFSQEQQNLLYESRNWNCTLGQGLIDWKAFYEVCEAQGTEAYVSEREYYHDGDNTGSEVECARKDYEFLRSL